MENKELKAKKDSELKDTLDEKREALRKFRFGLSGSKMKNMKEGIKTRKDIARILTELSLRKGSARVK